MNRLCYFSYDFRMKKFLKITVELPNVINYVLINYV